MTQHIYVDMFPGHAKRQTRVVGTSLQIVFVTLGMSNRAFLVNKEVVVVAVVVVLLLQ